MGAEVLLILVDLVYCRANHHNVYRLRHVGLGSRTRSLCKQWDVRMAAGSKGAILNGKALFSIPNSFTFCI